MKNKFISAKEAAAMIKDGDFVMVGGFLGHGTPDSIINAIADSDIKDLTIAVNDTGFPAADPENGVKGEKHGFRGVSELVARRKVKTLYVSHIGTNPETANQMNAGELEIEFCPQGTLAERIRAKGAGLGGVLTATGLGTIVAEGKEIITVDGKEYLLEKPLGADVAIIGASIADESGNLIYKGTTQNFNPIMATAADLVIAEAEQVVKTGELAPETIHTSGVYVDYIYKKQ